MSEEIKKNIINGKQCRAARALLYISQDELEKKSNVAKKTIADFERENRTPQTRTLRDIQRTFEEAGVEFETSERGFGIRLITKK